MKRSEAVGGNGRLGCSVAVMGHSRLVTNGAQENNQNNQPVVAGDMVGIHNGIIVNDEELWQRLCRNAAEIRS